MCIYACVCIYIRLCICAYKYVCVCVCALIQKQLHTHAKRQQNACNYLHVHVYACAYVCVYVCVCSLIAQFVFSASFAQLYRILQSTATIATSTCTVSLQLCHLHLQLTNGLYISMLLCAIVHCYEAERKPIKGSAVQMPGAQFNQIRNIKNLSGLKHLVYCVYIYMCIYHCCIATFDSRLLLTSHSSTQFLLCQQLLVVKLLEISLCTRGEKYFAKANE